MWSRMECAGISKEKDLATYQTGVQNSAQCVQGPSGSPWPQTSPEIGSPVPTLATHLSSPLATAQISTLTHCHLKTTSTKQ